MEGTSPTAARPGRTPEDAQPEALQLDRAEYAEEAGPATCAKCGQEILATYFEVNASVTCPTCHDQVVARATGGSGARRFRRALGWGGGGAVVGAALWMAITHWTGWDIGLVAILVGWMVGCGVRKGCDGRGGWRYQGLAVALTYLAIVATYVPTLHASLLDEGETPSEQTASGEPVVAPTGDGPSAVLALPLYALLLLGVACLVPLFSLPENLIGVLIIGFALFEAWKLNKRATLHVSGPFELVPPERQAAAA